MTVKDSFLWDGVTVADGCVVENAILCQGVTLYENSKLRHADSNKFQPAYIIGQEVSVCIPLKLLHRSLSYFVSKVSCLQ